MKQQEQEERQGVRLGFMLPIEVRQPWSEESRGVQAWREESVKQQRGPSKCNWAARE
jgi:hypothetical protein